MLPSLELDMLWVITALLNAPLFHIIQGEHSETEELIFEVKNGYILSPPSHINVIYRRVFVSHELDCAYRCTREKWCNSANFERISENALHMCELLSNDGDTGSKYLYQNERFFHLSIKAVDKPCKKQPCLNGGICTKVNNREKYKCYCVKGFSGKNCQEVYRDCSKLRSAGYTTDGVYQIDPDGQGSFPVYCDMTTNGGGWTVFQKNSKTSSISFSRGWQDYKTGFGNMTGEFWLGLEKILRLTKRQVSTLRVDLEDLNGNKKYAVYSLFSIADESDFYRLSVSGYSGTAGDSITTASNPYWINNNTKFSTLDKDNDEQPHGSCALERRSGWWYSWCTNSDLNGDKTWWTFSIILKNTEMKLNQFSLEYDLR